MRGVKISLSVVPQVLIEILEILKEILAHPLAQIKSKRTPIVQNTKLG